MPNGGYSVNEALVALEKTIRLLEPKVVFFFGEEDEQRPADGPKVIWDIEGSHERAPTDTKVPAHGTVQPRVFDADWVQVTATITGRAAPSNPAPNEKELRR